MGDDSGSDSDADDNAPAKTVPTPAPAAVAAPTTAPGTAQARKPQQPPPVVAAPKPAASGVAPGMLNRSSSKSELTNRLKSLYTSPPGPKGGVPSQVKMQQQKPNVNKPVVAGRGVSATATTAGRGITMVGAPAPGSRSVAAPPPVAAAASSRVPPGGGGAQPGPGNPNYIPPMVHTNHTTHGGGSSPPKQQQQQQQPHPSQMAATSHGQPQQQQHVVRVPAPLPKARNNQRSAPPANRVASVPIPNPRSAVGPPPPSPLTANNAGTAQTHAHVSSRQKPQQPQQYAHAPHLRAGQPTTTQQQQQPQQPQRAQPLMPNRPQMQQQPQQAGGARAAPGMAHGVLSGSDNRNLSDQEKKEKERFLMFTRVLMKYLEQRDAKMHSAAKAQIKECYEKNKAGHEGFKSLTTSMKVRLRSTVGENYWKKAQDYLDHFLKQKRKGYTEAQQKALQQQQQQQQQAGQVAGQVPTQVGQRLPSTSMHGAPPPIVPTSAPRLASAGTTQQQPNVMTQSQIANAAATKTPIARSAASTSVKPPATIPVSVPKSSAAATPLTAEEEKARKEQQKQAEAAKRKAERNAQARKKRAEKKKEKERLEAEAKAKAQGAAQTASSSVLSAGVGNVSGASAGSLPTGVGIQHGMHQSTSAVQSSIPPVGSGGGATPITSGAITSSTASVTSTASSKAKDKKTETKKKPTKKKPTTSSKTPSSTSLLKRKSSFTREPSKLMETIDHAVLIDVKSLPSLLSKEHKLDFNLDEEQRTLLYGNDKRRAKVKEICQAAAKALSDTDGGKDASSKKEADIGPNPLPWKLPAMYEGWGTKNVVSIRSAWAKVRLPESEAKQAEKEEMVRNAGAEPRTNGKITQQPMIMADRVSSGDVSSSKPQEGPASEATALKLEEDVSNHVWFNEKRAEQDPTLALLSEATELFLKSTIEKAIGQARLRKNIDGVRLWHTLHARSVNSTDADKPPPALIRLGCDVRRQIALSEGNAAKTYQRMEEAISRQNDSHYSTNSANDNPDKMLLEATSMSDLSKKPPLKSASQVADIDAKRKYAVFGGIDSQEPPFGRVPKKAKVILQDIVVGSDTLPKRGASSILGGTRRKRFQIGLRY